MRRITFITFQTSWIHVEKMIVTVNCRFHDQYNVEVTNKNLSLYYYVGFLCDKGQFLNDFEHVSFVYVKYSE